MRFFLLLLFTFSLGFLYAEDNLSLESNASVEAFEETQQAPEEEIQAKLLYQSYHDLPSKLFKGQIFKLTIKSLSAKGDFSDINYTFSDARGLKLLTPEPERKFEPPYFYDSFYFQVTQSRVHTPRIHTTLHFNDGSSALQEEFEGVKIDTVRLNPEDDFSSVLAEEFKILEYKTSQYDNQHNIVVFSSEGKMANLNDFSLKFAIQEGIDAYEADYPYATSTAFVVVSKQLNELKFSYFDINTRRFKDVIIPIIVDSDRVSTQTDLAPIQKTHATKKLILAAAVSVLGLVLFFFRRKKIFLLIVIIPFYWIIKYSVPTEHVCIESDSNIYLLPMSNGTIFEQVPYRFTTEALGHAQDFTKIRMHNKQIGWVKNENLCKN